MTSPATPLFLQPGMDPDTVLRALFSASPDAILLVDEAGRIVLANPAASQLLGYPPSELVGLNVEALVPDAVRPRHTSYRQSYAHHPRSRPMGSEMDLVAKRRDGTEVMVEISLSPLRGHGLPLVAAAIRDIGTYPRVKKALQRARYSDYLAQLGRVAVDSRELHVLLEQVPALAAEALQVEQAVVYLLDADRVHLRMASGTDRAGETAQPMLNRPETELGFVVASGRTLIVADYAQEKRFDPAPEILAAGLASGLAVTLSDRDRIIGVLMVRAAQPLRFGEGEARFLESISSLLATSLQRSHYEEAFNHAQRLESVGQLTGGIAHDFNNLLTVIQGNLQVMEESPALAQDESTQRLLAAAKRATGRGAELTAKLLAFSRRQVLQPHAVDVSALLQSLADMLRRTLDQRIQILVEALPCPACLADPGQLESALLNIAINARDAMPEGGTLRFSAQPCDALPSDVHREAGTRAEGAGGHGFIAISLTDTGTGMSDAVLERAFEPFFTTKPAGRGTGLGLSTVHGFVKQSKGGIAVDSVPGMGTTVTLYIPCAPSNSASSEREGQASEAVPPGLRVLLVEDDAEVRSVMRTFLDTLGCHTVMACATGEQALPMLSSGPPIELLLTDIVLGPGMRGTELANKARQRDPGMAVLLMSGFSTELLEADRESPPDWELLRKPCSRQELARAIVRAIR